MCYSPIALGKKVVRDRIVAVALLTDDDVTRLGSNFKRLWPVDETPCFQGLLNAIDDADREIRAQRQSEQRDASGQVPRS
jgi:hypothetical protein